MNMQNKTVRGTLSIVSSYNSKQKYIWIRKAIEYVATVDGSQCRFQVSVQ